MVFPWKLRLFTITTGTALFAVCFSIRNRFRREQNIIYQSPRRNSKTTGFVRKRQNRPRTSHNTPCLFCSDWAQRKRFGKRRAVKTNARFRLASPWRRKYVFHFEKRSSCLPIFRVLHFNPGMRYRTDRKSERRRSDDLPRRKSNSHYQRHSPCFSQNFVFTGLLCARWDR